MTKNCLFILLVCLSNVARGQAPTVHFNPVGGSDAYASNASGTYSTAFGKVHQNNNTAGNQAGSVAPEIEAIIQNVKYNFNGVSAPPNTNDQYSTRYAEFVLPLVNAAQKLTVLLDEKNKEINALKKQIAATGTEAGTGHKIAGSNRIAWLSQNLPNPSSAETDIAVSLPENTTNANLVFYTLEGKQLKLLHLYNRGDFTVTVDRNDLTRGICFYALMIEGKIIDSKQLLVK